MVSAKDYIAVPATSRTLRTEHAETAEPKITCKVWKVMFASLLGAVLLAIAASNIPGLKRQEASVHSQSLTLSGKKVALYQEQPAQCNIVQEGMDYWTKVALYTAMPIKSPRDCRNTCSDNRRCDAWTYGKKNGTHGPSNVCYLKELQPGELPRQVPAAGLTSGMVCREPQQRNDERKGSVVALTASDTDAVESTNLPIAVPSTTSTVMSSVHLKGSRPNNLAARAASALVKEPTIPRASTWLPNPYLTNPYAIPKDSPNDLVEPAASAANMVATMPLESAQVPNPYVASTMALALEQSPTFASTTDLSTTTVPTLQSSDTLFCFALMLPFGYERDLLAMQYQEGVSLFGCDEYAVYSNVSMEVAPGLDTSVVAIDLHCNFGGEFHTAMNAPIFRAVWMKVVSEERFTFHDWTVKVDPDCVFFPGRLRSSLAIQIFDSNANSQGVYLNNCRFGLHGPLEVFSTRAVQSLATGWETCRTYFHKLCSGSCFWGEDMFIDQCLSKVMKVKRVDDWTLLAEDHCDPPKGWESCTDNSKIAFHPFKTEAGYLDCLGNAKSEKEAPMYFK